MNFSLYIRVDTLCERDMEIGVDAITFDQVLKTGDECAVISVLLIQYGFVLVL